MDGLDDQAEAAIESIIDQLFTSKTVQIKHSSRDIVLRRVCDALQSSSPTGNNTNNNNNEGTNDGIDNTRPLIAQTLILRSGASKNGLRWLKETLLHENVKGKIKSLEFYCLDSNETVHLAIVCCRMAGIKRLSLKNFNTRLLLQNRDSISFTIRAALTSDPKYVDDDEEENNNNHLHRQNLNDGAGDLRIDYAASGTSTLVRSLYDPYNNGNGDDNQQQQQQQQQQKQGRSNNKGDSNGVMLEYFEIESYPLGAEGTRILADTISQSTSLKTLKLIDCNLRSDSTNFIAQMIKQSTSLETLDISYNPHYLGSSITREMALKTLVRRGLKQNMTLMELIMEQTRKGDTIKRTKIDEQLQINKFYKYSYKKPNIDPITVSPPSLWSNVYSRVSSKPTALYLFLQDSAPTLFLLR